MESVLEALWPVWTTEQDCIVSKNGDYTVGFEVTKPEIFTLAAEQYVTLHGAFAAGLGLLPAGTILYMQDWYTRSTYQANIEKAGESFLGKASERYFHERAYMDHRCYLFLTRRAGKHAVNSGSSSIFRRNLAPKETLDSSIVTEFISCAERFAQVLSDNKLIRLRRLREEEIWSYSGKTGLLEQYSCLLRPGEPAVLSDISFTNGIRVGDKVCQLFTLADVGVLPASCGPYRRHGGYSTEVVPFIVGFTSSLGATLNCDHIYSQYITVGDRKTTLKRMESKRQRLHALSNYSRENAVASEAVSRYITEAIEEDHLPVKAHFNVLAWGRSGEENVIRNAVASALAQLGVTPHIETVGAAQLWYSGIPGNAGEIPENEQFDTFAEQAACFLNLETNYRTSVSSFGLRLGDRVTGRPLHVDISEDVVRRGLIGNRGKFILGSSGAGKSFFCATMVRAYYEQGAHVIITDIGHSYRGLCELLGGYYFTYSVDNPLRFNPFHLGVGDRLNPEKTESIKALLLALWKRDDESLNRSEYVVLSNALQLYYDKLDHNPAIFPCFDSFYEFLRDDFATILLKDKVKEKDFDIENFLYVLRPFFRGGEYDYLLNASENISLLDHRLIVFELDAIRDHPILLSVTVIVLMDVSITKMRKLQGVRKLMLFDEVWKPIAKKGMAEYLKFLAKTARKFFGEPVYATQEIDDIISSPIVKNSIINLSDCKILLDMGKLLFRFDEVQALLGLTEHQKALVLSLNKANDPDLNYKEVYIGLGSESKVYRTEVSLEEYLTYTTEEREKVKIMEYAKKYGSLRRGIQALAAEIRAGGTL
jgi:conjugation system TraG family ATPase